MELTIEELAQRTSMTGRNIRQWQTYGLLPPPERRGRVGIYTQDHVSRINRVKELRAQGFPLDLIRRVLDTPGMDVEDVDVEGDVRHLASGTLAPFANAERLAMSEQDLEARFGAGVAGPLQDAGLAEWAGDASDVLVMDATVLTLLEAAATSGLPVAAYASTLAKAQDHHRAIAALLLDMVREQLWQPFIEAGMPAGKWRDLADTVDRLRVTGVAAQSYLFQRALDEVLTGVLVEEAGRLKEQLPPAK